MLTMFDRRKRKQQGWKCGEDYKKKELLVRKVKWPGHVACLRRMRDTYRIVRKPVN
jgi:hypothetical protein